MGNIPCLKHASTETLKNLHDHKYIGPALSFIEAFDDVERINKVLSVYKYVDESQWAAQHEKWRRIEQVEKNPNSRENLLKKLDELKRRKSELLKKYKASKETCDRLEAKIYNAKSSKEMRITGDAFLNELDGKASKVESQLAEKAMSFRSTKIASSSHLTLSFEVGNLVHSAAKRASNLLGVSDLFVYDECPTDLSELLKMHGLLPILVTLRRKMEAIYEHWNSSDYSSPEKLMRGAEELLRQNPGICSAQRIAGMRKSDIEKLPMVPRVPNPHQRPRRDELGDAINQLTEVYGEVLSRISAKARAFDEEVVPKISKTIDALSYDALSIHREFTSLFQELDRTDYSQLLIVPVLLKPGLEVALRPLILCHEFIKSHLTISLQDRIASLLEKISKEDEQIAAKSLEMLLSNVLVRYKNNLRSQEGRYLNNLEEARKTLISEIPDKLSSLKKIESEKNRLYSTEFYQQASSFLKEDKKE